MCFVLDNEKVPYDKKVLAEYVQLKYPDFRSTVLGLQKASQMFGKIDEEVFKAADNTVFTSLIDEIKAKEYTKARKIVSDTDPDAFYQTFYDSLDTLLEPTCIPDVVILLGRFAYESALTTCKEVTLASCVTELMKSCKWK
jgi:hypothetical protein